MKIKLRKSDVIFSQYIRQRAKWKCEVPTCQKDYKDNPQGIHCSHYWGRGRENTRHDPENCIALCFYHHRLWGHGDERDNYTRYMEKRLGKQGFKNLKIRAFQYKKKDETLAIMYAQLLLNSLCLTKSC